MSERTGRNAPCPCGSGKKFKQCCQKRAEIRTNTESVANLIELGKRHHQAAELKDALACYQKALSTAPDHPDALHYLGILYAQSGNSALAIELMRKSTQLDPANPIFANNLGTALQREGEFAGAAGSYRKAIASNPNEPDYYNNLAIVLNELGRFDDAIGNYRSAIALNPDNPLYYNNLGLALNAQGKPEEAIAAYEKALRIEPKSAGTLNNLGIVFKQQGRLDDAVATYRDAISYAPGMAQVHSNLANALLAQGKIKDSIESCKRAVSLNPDYPEAHYNLGNALKELGRLDDALQCYNRALSLKPDYAEAHNNLGNTLRDQGRLDEAIASFHKALLIKPDFAMHNNLGTALRDQGRLDEAVASYRKALSFKPDYPEAHSNLLYTLQFCPAESPAKILAEAARFAAQFEDPLKAHWQPHPNLREPGRRLKVAYISPDFRHHAVAFFIEPILANHDKERVEVFCYYNHAQHDEITARLAGYADHWLDCKGMTDRQLAEHIRADGIDILVDLAGHTAHNRILTVARKPAPIQITYLGYPGTSGLAAMDYRLTDGCADPAGSEIYYTEKLLRLPDILCCYRPGKGMPEVGALPAQRNGYVTFGSFNNFNKIDRPCIKLWAHLLRALPNSRLLMVTVPEGASRRRLAEEFAALGISAERLEFHGKLPGSEFYGMFQRADIALDPFPVTGGTTTCESLWMGLPVIVLVGARYISRVGYSFLSAAGLREFAAETTEGYIEVARRLAGNLPRLAEARAGMRAQVANSPLVDEAKFTRNLEKIYRDVWTEWCNTII